MEEDKKTKEDNGEITILFGAGADSSYDIGQSNDFAKSVIGLNENSKIIDEAIKDFYKEKLKKVNKKEWYPENFVSNSYSQEKLVESCLEKKYLDMYYKTEENEIKNKKEYEETIKNEKNLFFKDIKNENGETKRQLIEDKRDDFNILVNDYTSYMGMFEDYFLTIINPKILGPQKFTTLITCYTRAYLKIVCDILKIKNEDLTKEKCLEILKKPKEVYQDIVKKIESMNVEKSYYETIKGYKNINIVTTNYTPICEIKTEISKEKISYLHGKLNLFEDPYEMLVYDVLETDVSDKFVFPYIFIQSAIKPIVERREIKEYSKTIDFLDKSRCLIIIGYRINSDDNHINSIIKEYLLNNKVIYFDYDNLSREKILKRLRVNEASNFEYIKINEENCCAEFESELEKLFHKQS